ncbi:MULTISPECIES: hypothetical protein [Flavobacteriaceae]|nr:MULTISPECIES: hypothetical protein [Allomuricauda]MDC6365527.1 hypothetical protein [Muricauda sp. AC10]
MGTELTDRPYGLMDSNFGVRRPCLRIFTSNLIGNDGHNIGTDQKSR